MGKKKKNEKEIKGKNSENNEKKNERATKNGNKITNYNQN